MAVTEQISYPAWSGSSGSGEESYMKIHVKIQASPRLSVAQKPCLLSKAFITHFLAIGRVANRVSIRLYLPGSAELSGMLSSSIVSLTSLRNFTHKTEHY